MPDEKILLQCYNRGCGQKYDPENNKPDSCRHHPGLPIFHDAYKGWGCCNKKCTDFTEFLNIKGCTLSMHSNIKPPEPEKPVLKDVVEVEIKPIIASALERPPFDTPLVLMKPEIASSLQQQMLSKETNKPEAKITTDTNEVAIGTTCKNGGCGLTYQGPETNGTICIYHSGVPIFHEGLKYWSCCQKKTTDFNAFLNQIGCETGTHVWKKDSDEKVVDCRWDFHQTGSHVVVSIYAKQYDSSESVVKLNPIRLYAKLVFPQQSNSSFSLDFELKGIINVDESHVTMYGTKVEIKMKKAEPGSWTKLGIPIQKEKPQNVSMDQITPAVDAVNLDDL